MIFGMRPQAPPQAAEGPGAEGPGAEAPGAKKVCGVEFLSCKGSGTRLCSFDLALGACDHCSPQLMPPCVCAHRTAFAGRRAGGRRAAGGAVSGAASRVERRLSSWQQEQRCRWRSLPSFRPWPTCKPAWPT